MLAITYLANQIYRVPGQAWCLGARDGIGEQNKQNSWNLHCNAGRMPVLKKKCK